MKFEIFVKVIFLLLIILYIALIKPTVNVDDEPNPVPLTGTSEKDAI